MVIADAIANAGDASEAAGKWKLFGLIRGTPPLGKAGKRRLGVWAVWCLLLVGCTRVPFDGEMSFSG